MKDATNWAGIARMGGIGDNIIASSVLPGLKKRYGNVDVMTSPPQHVIFENNPYIDKLSVRPEGDPPWGDGHSWQQWFQSRAKDYKFFANLCHSCESLGAALRVETAFWWNKNMRRKRYGRSYLELVHDICEIPYEEANPNFYPTDEEHAKAEETKAKMGKKVIGWAISGSRLDKMHPELDRAVSRVLKETGVPVVLLGAPGKDFEIAKNVLNDVEQQNKGHEGLHLALSPDPVNPTWPIRRLLTLAQHCDVVVAPDTGLGWSVSMHTMPKVIMVSHASAENITKYWKNTLTLHADQKRVPCHPCHQLHDGRDTCTPNRSNSGAACISDISIDDLVTAVKAALSGKQVTTDDFECGAVIDKFNAPVQQNVVNLKKE